MLTLNTDRHFNNLGIIVNKETGIYKPAPIFDNGSSLLSDFERFNPLDSDVENIEKVYGKPFSSNLEMQASAVGIGLKIDYEKLESIIDNECETRAIRVLKHQIEKYRNIIPECHIENSKEKKKVKGNKDKDLER